MEGGRVGSRREGRRWPAAITAEADQQPAETSHPVVARPVGASDRGEVGKAGCEVGDRRAGLEPVKGAAQAEMDAGAEAEMTVRPSSRRSRSRRGREVLAEAARHI